MSFVRRCLRGDECPFLCAVVLLSVIILFCAVIGPVKEGFSGSNELVLYHMNGCPHCVKMMPEWAKFEKNNDTSIKTRKTERGEKPDEVKKHGIKGFPSVLLLDGNGDKVKSYEGPRTADGLLSFCKQNS